MDKPVLSKQAFWDVDMDKINYEKDLLYVIEQVIDWGSLDDFLSLIKFYGEDKIGKEVLNTKCLGDREINFCYVIFHLKITDFKYYEKKPSRSHQKFIEDYQNYLN